MMDVVKFIELLKESKNNANGLAKNLEQLSTDFPYLLAEDKNISTIFNNLIESHLQSMKILGKLLYEINDMETSPSLQKENLYDIIDTICDEKKKEI